MATNGVETRVQVPQRRKSWIISGIVLRLIIAFILSWLIVMAFFVTGVVSH